MGSKNNRPTITYLHQSNKLIPTSQPWHPNYPGELVNCGILVIRRWTEIGGEHIWGRVVFSGMDDHYCETNFEFTSIGHAASWYERAIKWQNTLAVCTGYNLDKTCPKP
jgi:hypothetical protein